MKIFVATILFFLVMSQSFKNWYYIAEYKLNKNYIARSLCENRDKPKMHCNGKCILAKRMAAAEENSSSPMPPLKFNWEVSVFVDTYTEYSSVANDSNLALLNPTNKLLRDDNFSARIFRPPIS